MMEKSDHDRDPHWSGSLDPNPNNGKSPLTGSETTVIGDLPFSDLVFSKKI
jgi:hypothetical protein